MQSDTLCITSPARRILRLPEVMKMTGFGRTSIYLMMARGEFPRSCQIGPRNVGWDSLAVQAWIDSKLGALE